MKRYTIGFYIQTPLTWFPQPLKGKDLPKPRGRKKTKVADIETQTKDGKIVYVSVQAPGAAIAIAQCRKQYPQFAGATVKQVFPSYHVFSP